MELEPKPNMKISKSRWNKIENAILEGIKQDGHWFTITKCVKTSGLKIDNWLEVRNILQDLINRRVIVRKSDTMDEIYIILS